MKKFLTIAGILLMAFALSGVALAKRKHAPKKAEPTKREAEQAIKEELKTVEGQISTVDTKAKTFVVAEGTNSMTFNWDKKTRITVAGHAVKPSALVSGAKVTVHYLEKDNKNWARSIVITPAVPATKKK